MKFLIRWSLNLPFCSVFYLSHLDIILCLLFSCLLFVFCVFFLKNKFIYLFLAVLGLCCCVQAFCSCGERGLLFVAVRRLFIAVASSVVEHRL